MWGKWDVTLSDAEPKRPTVFLSSACNQRQGGESGKKGKARGREDESSWGSRGVSDVGKDGASWCSCRQSDETSTKRQPLKGGGRRRWSHEGRRDWLRGIEWGFEGEPLPPTTSPVLRRWLRGGERFSVGARRPVSSGPCWVSCIISVPIIG